MLNSRNGLHGDAQQANEWPPCVFVNSERQESESVQVDTGTHSLGTQFGIHTHFKNLVDFCGLADTQALGEQTDLLKKKKTNEHIQCSNQYELKEVEFNGKDSEEAERERESERNESDSNTHRISTSG